MFEIEVRDTKIPIVSFLRTLVDKILHFFKHLGKIFLEFFNPTKWSWPHWIFAIVFIIILALGLVNSFAGVGSAFWIYKKSIMFFLISMLIFIYFIIITVTYANNITFKSEYDILNKTFKYIHYFVVLMLFGIVFSGILAPNGINKLIYPFIYLKDCIIIVFVISFIIFFYNMILLVILE
jgi:cytochrome b561